MQDTRAHFCQTACTHTSKYFIPWDACHKKSLNKAVKYYIAENFYGRILLQISWFVAICRSFLSETLRTWHNRWHQLAICESFLHKNHMFHQFAKVFSLERFLLYGKEKINLLLGKWYTVKFSTKYDFLEMYLWHFL